LEYVSGVLGGSGHFHACQVILLVREDGVAHVLWHSQRCSPFLKSRVEKLSEEAGVDYRSVSRDIKDGAAPWDDRFEPA